jgi:parallel beta-helix repeat protein
MMKNCMIKKGSVVSIVLLFILINGFSSLAYSATKTSSLIPRGEWLYVGGSVPGNYTKIQDAIDNASNTDSIFVFSGTYYENLRINKSISLLGENQASTIIDGQETNGHVVSIITEGVTLCRFTIQNCGGASNAAEIYVVSDNNYISENTLLCIPVHGEEGIWLWQSSGNTITRNTIATHHYGIWLENSDQNNISDNYITGIWDWGIILGNSDNNIIFRNNLTENSGGIYVRDSNENKIFRNEIIKNSIGIELTDWDSTSSNNTIEKNNFLKNSRRDATFMAAKKSHTKNTWDENYWNRPLRFPKLILGGKEFLFFPGTPFHFPPMMIALPWFNVDWHPAQEPYEIGEVP